MSRTDMDTSVTVYLVVVMALGIYTFNTGVSAHFPTGLAA